MKPNLEFTVKFSVVCGPDDFAVIMSDLASICNFVSEETMFNLKSQTVYDTDCDVTVANPEERRVPRAYPPIGKLNIDQLKAQLHEAVAAHAETSEANAVDEKATDAMRESLSVLQPVKFHDADAPSIAFSLNKGVYKIMRYDHDAMQYNRLTGFLDVIADRSYRYDIDVIDARDPDGNPLSLAIGIASVEDGGVVVISHANQYKIIKL